MVDVLAFCTFMDAIEARFESERDLHDLERRVRADERLDADDREYLLRRIGFYRDEFHRRGRSAELCDRADDR